MQNPVSAIILTIGDELLYGQVLNTNTQVIAEALTSIGIRVRYQWTVGDVKEDIVRAFQDASQLAQIVVSTGGLGPTADDLTMPILNELTESQLRFDEDTWEHIVNLLQQRGKELADYNRSQAMVPSEANIIPNKLGTAPGLWFDRPDERTWVALPGVPHEMEQMVYDELLPALKSKYLLGAITHVHIQTAWIAEAKLSSLLSDWEKKLPKGVSLAYLPYPGQVVLRLTSSSVSKSKLEQIAQQLPESVKKSVLGIGKMNVEEWVGKALLERGQTLATAESCTGGYVAHLITKLAGCSQWYNGGIVAYSNGIKEHQLGVKIETLKAYGAVSEQTAKEMAERAREKYKSSFAVATTGVAGPTGGSPEKPVGTVWLAVAGPTRTITKLLNLTSDRWMNIRLTQTAAMYYAWREINELI